MAKANNLGVEAIKNGLTITAGIVKSSFSADTNGDGKVDSGERLAFIGSILPQTFPLFTVIPAAAEEIRDKITAEEREELVDHAVSLDFLPEGRDVAEEYIKLVILWINYNIRFVNKSIQFFSKRELTEIAVAA